MTSSQNQIYFYTILLKLLGFSFKTLGDFAPIIPNIFVRGRTGFKKRFQTIFLFIIKVEKRSF